MSRMVIYDGLWAEYVYGSYDDGFVVVRMGNSTTGGLISLELTEAIWSRLNGLACATGIDESAETAIHIYPNPASTTINIERNSFSSEAHVNVFNGLGQIQKSVGLSHTKTVDISGLAVGVYLLQVLEGDRHFVTRFVKE
ncbi:MAG: T9SS type A sorting domain-containing protein [Flavobacteriales bacterium]|nr:T9SS type A sorting domain-containing protein [Flavobacteriales bacterium]